MEYRGSFKIFDLKRIKTYPLRERTNKVTLKDIVRPSDIEDMTFNVSTETEKSINTVAEVVVARRKANTPVIFFTGGHLIKNGLGLLLAELVRNEIITLVAGNGSTAIHDFELALIGETSEHVPHALSKGQFGMAYEFNYINTALIIGNRHGLGFGEALGKMVCEDSFRNDILSEVLNEYSPKEFLHPDISVIAACYKKSVPLTIHAGIGTDVIDQHYTFNGEAKGGCSARDFLIFVEEVTKLDMGGVIINVGSAVTGPEVLLKAVSMASNIGKSARNILCVDFDIRSGTPEEMNDESSQGYYFRDQKSVVTRIPMAFNGKGIYVQGDQKQTIPLLYKRIFEKI